MATQTDESIDPVPQLPETEHSLALPSFTHATAFQLGTVILSLALVQHPNSTIFISIAPAITPPTHQP